MGHEFFEESKDSYLKCRKSATCAYRLDYHLVIATKFRRSLLEGEVARVLVEAVMECCERHGYKLLGLAVVPDHVHLLVSLRPTDRPCDAVGRIKGFSSYRIKGEFPQIEGKIWGAGYSLDTVGPASVPQIVAYLQRQQDHHVFSVSGKSRGKEGD